MTFDETGVNEQGEIDYHEYTTSYTMHMNSFERAFTAESIAGVWVAEDVVLGSAVSSFMHSSTSITSVSILTLRGSPSWRFRRAPTRGGSIIYL